METNSYQRLKDFVFTNLQKTRGILHETQIADEISNTKALIEKVSLDVFAQFLHDKSSLTKLEEVDWERMKKELEVHFNVKMETGVLIKGEEQQKRDTSWWTGVQKQRNEKYYWNRYKNYMEASFSPEVIKTIDIDTDIVMDNIENPTFDRFDRYGMVVGHVQSGKTANYSALICKAADAGYKFIVVIAGGINNLRNQTQKRINEAFTGQNKGVPVGVGRLGGVLYKPLSLTTEEQDFNNRDADRNAQGLNFDNISTPVILVIKKNTNTLTNVITWLEAQYINQISKHAMLLIDDESDYASINTAEKEDPSIINKKLRKLLSLFQKSAYVAFTATPYANIFIDHEAGHEDVGRDLFPKDFIYALDAPTNYFGARRIFLDTNGRHLVPINDYSQSIPPRHRKEHNIETLPESLFDAVRVFVLNVAIRYLRGQSAAHNSMLIHATRFTNVHQKIAIQVQIYIEALRKEINAYCRLENPENRSGLLKDLKETLESRHPSVEFDWNKVVRTVCEIIETIVVREVHQSKSVPLEYRDDRTTNAIVIGGASLSRGYTLEGLSVSYFLRNTIFYDTLMQMGRWFGYRSGYEDLCKVYLPPAMIENFALIIEATEDLIDDFKRMAERKMTPNDFGLCVKHHPESQLQVTARNKMKSSQDIYFDMKLDGHAKETAYLLKDAESRQANINAIEHLIQNLNKKKKYEEAGSAYLWRDIEKNAISDFLNEFRDYQRDPFGIKTRMPMDFVKKYVMDVETFWDVALYSGFGEKISLSGLSINKEERQIEVKNDCIEINGRQVASGNAEAIVFSSEERKKLGSLRKDTREKMRKPLLMLHILQPKDNTEIKGLAAFGISFPGGIKTGNKNIRLKINTVYIQDLLNQEQDSDD